MRLSMREFGRVSGPALLLLHGAGTDHTTWQSQIDHLSNRYRILAPDLPGCGESPGPFDLGRAATAVAGHLQDASAVDRVHVCGLSLGAMVGLQIAATRPAIFGEHQICYRPFQLASRPADEATFRFPLANALP